MQVRIGLENNNEGRSIAWALEHFGCFSYGKDGPSAVASLAKSIPEYIEWMESHTTQSWFNPVDIEIRLVETVDDYSIDKAFDVVEEGGRQVQAWFITDWKPLTQIDVEHILQVISWSRVDLLDLVTPLTDAQLDR